MPNLKLGVTATELFTYNPYRILGTAVDTPAEKKTLKLLKGIDADVYRTSTDGTIVVQANGAGDYAVSCQRVR